MLDVSAPHRFDPDFSTKCSAPSAESKNIEQRAKNAFTQVNQLGAGMAQTGAVELRVSENHEEILIYTFPSVGKAAEMVHFLTEFFPQGRFVIQPVRH